MTSEQSPQKNIIIYLMEKRSLSKDYPLKKPQIVDSFLVSVPRAILEDKEKTKSFLETKAKELQEVTGNPNLSLMIRDEVFASFDHLVEYIDFAQSDLGVSHKESPCPRSSMDRATAF